MSSPLKLLFVEDMPSEVDLAVRQFQRSGVTCEWRRVETEPDLRRELREFRPHVVLSDFSMPRFDGWSALACVRSVSPEVPFLFVSGTIGEEGAINALRQGAMDYVLKDNLGRLVPAVQRAQREAELHAEQRRAEQQLRDIIDTSQDWIWELDADHRLIFSSPSATAMLGRTPEQLLGQDFLTLVGEADRDSAAHELASLSATRRTTRLLLSCDTERGPRRWLDTNVIALVDDTGAVVGRRGSSRDVTEQQQQQQRILHLTRVLRMVSGVNAALVRLRDRDTLLQETCRLAVNIGGYISAMVSLVEPAGDLRVAVAAGIRNDDTIGLRLPLGSIANVSELSITARAAQSRALVVIRGLDDPALPAATRELMQQAGMRALVALPLVVDTAAVGVLTLCASTPEDIDGQELKLLQELAANLSFALQYVERENAVHFLSNFDALTGLAKRSRFCERLQQRLAHRIGPEARPAVVVLDLERLGLINDSAGRQVGDGLLQGVADRLRRHVDDNDSLAYLGAGTYAAVLPIIGARDSAFAILHERIAALFTAPYEVDGHTIRTVARCGIARFPEDGTDSRSLLEHAEAALKTAKAAGERFLPYQLQMQQGHNERLALEQRLHVAIEERQFELHYQPKIDIGSGRLVGLEALLRWQDPTRGLVAPGEFLPVLEATQMIVEVGDWVLDQAVTDLRRWVAAGLSTRIAVNVSPWQLRRHDFANRLLARLGDDTWQGRAGLDLEITETALLQDPDDTLHKLALLRGSGVQIAIDDFGTGYSSLSRLSLLPVDTLKIDRSFTSGLPHAPAALALVSTIIALARAFQLTTVAEGVETPDQLQMLRELGCHQSQGFLHSRPVPFREATLRLEQERARLPAPRDAEPASFRPEATSLRR